MKKMYKYILIITLMMFGFIGEVRANSINKICSYTISNNEELESIDIYYNTVDSEYQIKVNGGGFKKITTEKKGDYFMTENVEKSLKKAGCPKNIYYDEEFICFDTDKDSNYCTTNNFESSFWGIERKFTKTNKIVKLNSEEDDGKKSQYTVKKVFKTNIIDKTKLNITPTAPFNSCVDASLSGDLDENNVAYCEIACYYYDKDLTKFAFIYFYKNKFTESEKFQVSFSWSDKAGGQGNTRVLFDDNKPIQYASVSKEAKDSLIYKDKTCPLKAYRNDYETSGEGRICFENDDRHCLDKDVNILVNEEDGGFENEENDEVIEDLEEELNNTSEKKECEDAEKIILSKLNVSEVDEVCGFSRLGNRFFIALSNGKYSIFEGEKKLNGNLTLEQITDSQEVTNFSYSSTGTCKAYPAVYHPDGVFTPDKSWELVDWTYNYYCSISKNGTSDIGDPIIDDNNDCQSLLGVSLVEEINSYLLYIKIAVPILIIVLGSIDFVKAFIASDEDKMKKAQKHFIMRLIIGMVIFFVPAILNALLNIANQVWGIFGNTCGITF